MVTKVYVLGSGSSIGHSNGLFPSIGKFFSCGSDFGVLQDDKYSGLRSYVKELIGQDIFRTQKDIDIEALMTHIEIDLERKNSPDLLKLRRDLLDLIRSVLIAGEERLPSPEGEYHAFFNVLDKRDSIITFNWDLMLDNILGRSPILVKNNSNDRRKASSPISATHYQQFINELSAIGEKTWQGAFIREPYYDWNPNAGYYLKAHGSIDWFYCLNEGCRFFRKVFPLLEPMRTHYCSECHETLECLLIPPVLNKGYRTYPLIRRIWNMAAKVISSAEELVIWGYSLPPTDFYSAWLLRQCGRETLKTLAIVNPSVLTSNRDKVNAKFVKPFRELMQDKVTIDASSLYENFTDFRTNNNLKKKRGLRVRTPISRL